MDYQSIYNDIKTEFKNRTGETVSDDGDFGIRMQVVAGELFYLYQQMDFVTKQMFPQTATGEYLEHHAAIRDLYKKKANAAGGKLMFKRSTPALQDIQIPLGTVCTMSSGNGIMYATTEDGILKKGSTSVLITARATVTGKDTNAAAGKIDSLVSSISGVESVSNPENFTGGMEEEDDESFRKRLLDSYVNVSNGANLKFYENFAMSYPDVWTAKAMFSTTENNKLILYVSDIFRMTPDSLCQQIQNDIQNARELNIQVEVKAPEVVEQNLRVTVFVKDMQNASFQVGNAEDYFIDRIYKMGIGENFNPYTAAKDIASVVEGYDDIIFNEPLGLVEVEPGQILSPGSISISLERKG